MTLAAFRSFLMPAVAAGLFLAGFTLPSAGAGERPQNGRQPLGQAPQLILQNVGSERSLAGWRSSGARLTLVPSSRSTSALHTAGTKGRSGRFMLYAAPRPVRWARKKASFAAEAQIRGSKAANVLCLSLREIARGGRIVQARSSCRPAGAKWARVAVRGFRTKRKGSQVGLVVTGRNPGWFQADDVSLVRTLAGRAGRKCKPGANCATVPPTTTTTATTTAPGATTTTTTVPTTTTTGTTTTTTTGTTTTTPPPPAPANARVARIEGSFDFDQTNASPASGVSDPTTLRLVSDRVYEGGGAAHAHLAANAASSNKFSRGIFHNLTWGAGTDVWYGVAVYLPVGFYAAQQGQIDLLRWDNWVDDPSTTDRGGITIYGPPAAGKAYLFRGRIGSPQNELVGPFSLSEGSWHWLEVHQRFSPGNTSDLSELYVDGAFVGRSTAPNWYGRRMTSVRFGLVAVADPRQSNGLDLWFDRASVSSGMLGPAR